MAVSSTRWARPCGRLSTAMCRHALDAAAPGVAKVLRDLRELGGEQFAPRNDHEIDRGRGALRTELPEHLSNQAFGPIALDCAAELPGGDDAEPGSRQPVREQQEREKPAVKAGAAIEHGAELAATSNPPAFGESERGRLRTRLPRRISWGSAIVRDGPVPDAGIAFNCARARTCRQRRRLFQEPPRAGPLRRGNGQALAPFCAPSLDNQTAVLRSHPGQEAMGAPPPAAIRLKRAFTLHNDPYPCETELCRRKPRW